MQASKQQASKQKIMYFVLKTNSYTFSHGSKQTHKHTLCHTW